MTKQKHLRLDDDVVKLVDDWRREQNPIPSFNHAVNCIIRSGLISLEIVKQQLREELEDKVIV